MTTAQVDFFKWNEDKKMHHEYAVEQVVSQWEAGNKNDADILANITEDEVLDLASKKASEVSNETIAAIIGNMREAELNKYKTVTSKQLRAVASFLLQEYHSIPKVISNAFDMGISELFSSIEVGSDELAVTQGHVVTLSLGVAWKEEGDILPASKTLSELIESNEGHVPKDAMSTEVNGHPIWVSFPEFKAFDLKEVDVAVCRY